MEWDDIQQALQASVKSAEAYLISPWFYMQAGIILAAAGLSLALASFLRARVSPTSLAMGLPAPLRALIRILLNRADAIIFALLTSIAPAVVVKTEVLRHGYLLSTAASLATAWVIIRLATGLIRNEFVVRAVSVTAWIIAALSIIGKLERKGLPVTIESAEANLQDIAGVRIVCNYIDDIYRLADLLVRQQDLELVARKDYIENPKPNGYRSLHLVLRVPVYLSSHTELVPVEVQIRTIAMDFWASLEHELRYKNDVEATAPLKDRLKRCAEQSAALDVEMQSIYREMRGMAGRRSEDYEVDGLWSDDDSQEE